MANPDRIMAIEFADEDVVEDVKEYNSKKLVVTFWRHAAKYYLKKDQSNFKHIRAVLEESAKRQSQIWLSLQIPENLIVDARPVKPKKAKENIMTAEAVLLFNLRLLYVDDIREAESVAIVQFEKGLEGRLPKTDKKKYAEFIEDLRYAQKHKCPVVVTMAKPNEIVAVEPADEDTVHYVEEKDAKTLKVAFWRHAAFYYLSRENPDFKRVRNVLEKAAKDHTQIWLSFQIPENWVVDAQPVRPKKDKKDKAEEATKITDTKSNEGEKDKKDND